MPANSTTISKSSTTTTSLPHQKPYKTLGEFKSAEVGGLIIGEFPSHLDALVTRTFKSNHLIAPLTGPLHTALHLLGWVYALYATASHKQPQQQLPRVSHLDHLQQAIVRCEALWFKLFRLLDKYAKSHLASTATATNVIKRIGQFKFVDQFDLFFEKGLGRYTLNFQAFCPFLEEIGEFNRTTEMLIDEVKEWALERDSEEDEVDDDNVDREELD